MFNPSNKPKITPVVAATMAGLGVLHLLSSSAAALLLPLSRRSSSFSAAAAATAGGGAFFADRSTRHGRMGSPPNRNLAGRTIGTSRGGMGLSASSSSSASASSSSSAGSPLEREPSGPPSDERTTMIRLVLETVEETEEVGALLASSLLLPRGDDSSSSSSSSRQRLKGCVMCLDGDLGAGKTALARGFVRAATGDWDRRVTSPTYLLSNTYRIDERNVDIHHMDLYRLSDRPEEQDLLPLNLDYVFENCVSLIEWPSRIGADRIPSERLDVQINIMQLPVTDDESDGNDEQNNESSEDRPRLMLLKPRGTDWENILRELRDEGYLDDLLG